MKKKKKNPGAINPLEQSWATKEQVSVWVILNALEHIISFHSSILSSSASFSPFLFPSLAAERRRMTLQQSGSVCVCVCVCVSSVMAIHQTPSLGHWGACSLRCHAKYMEAARAPEPSLLHDILYDILYVQIYYTDNYISRNRGESFASKHLRRLFTSSTSMATEWTPLKSKIKSFGF